MHGGDNCRKRRAGSSGIRLWLGGAEPFPPIDKPPAHAKYWHALEEIKEKSSELWLLCFPQNTRKLIRGHLTSHCFQRLPIAVLKRDMRDRSDAVLLDDG